MVDDPERPEYRKYRSAPTLPWRRQPGTFTPERGRENGDDPRRTYGRPRRARRPLAPGRIVKYVLLAVAGWLALSLVLFLASAQLHQSDVADGSLGGAGYPLASPNTVLVLGSDQRTAKTAEPGSSTSGPSRSDSILLMRVGGGASARLSIPRDTVVDIPGSGRNKINAAYAIGGADLAVRTIEQFLGIDINHLVEVDFDSFPELIDAMGGIDYTGGCVVSRINGGARNGGYTLRLPKGTNHLDGEQALALARTRTNLCNRNESDLTRARRQQKIFAAMKDRLTSPGAFVRLPLISWNAPKAIRSDMSGPTLLGLFGSLAVSGTPATRVLKPSGGVTLPDGGSGLVVSEQEKVSEVERFLDG